jgi:hypothetical protein
MLILEGFIFVKKKNFENLCYVIFFCNFIQPNQTKLNLDLGSYACLEILLEFQRDIVSYVNEIYVPSSLVVSVMFVSFFIDKKSEMARVALGTTSVVSLTTMFGGDHLLFFFFVKPCFLRNMRILFFEFAC